MTHDATDRAVALLGDFIAFHTENPTGDELALCTRLADELHARRAGHVEVVEVARTGKRPGAYVFARYGEPRLILDVHVDTVPVNQGWTRDPFQASVEGDRIYGLGSADTKGAIAAILTAIDEVGPENIANLAILFSGDEEAGSEVIHAFARSERMRGLERAILCEPTRRAAGVLHRGIRAYRARMRGKGGHSSGADHMPKPIVTLARLAVALDELGARYLDHGPPEHLQSQTLRKESEGSDAPERLHNMKGLCMNVAALDGGVAFNVVPEEATLRWSVRPPPGFDSAAFEEAQDALAGAESPVELVIAHDPFACRAERFYRDLLGARVTGFVPLDFWTEAAVFSAAGVDAIVVGPGDIAQAHAADEFVTRDDLAWAIELFSHVIKQCAR